MPLGWVAGAVALGAVAEGYSAYTSNRNAQDQFGLEKSIFNEQQGYAQMLQQLVADPSSVASLPGYQFQLSQGSLATAQQMATSGYLGSGTEALELTKYGQGLASSFYGQQTQLLASLSGLTNPSSPSQLGAASTAASRNSSDQFNNLAGQFGLLAGKYASASTPAAAAPAATDAAGIFAAG